MVSMSKKAKGKRKEKRKSIRNQGEAKSHRNDGADTLLWGVTFDFGL
jgi:hypothetical protein